MKNVRQELLGKRFRFATVALLKGLTACHSPARFVASGEAGRGVGNGRVASCVTRMPLPPRTVPSPSAPQIQQRQTTASLDCPLLGVEEIIVALVEVFVAYKKQHCGSLVVEKEATAYDERTSKNETTEAEESCRVEVPFYPPVPLKYLEENFQHLLLRLLPAGAAAKDGYRSQIVRVSGCSSDAEENRRCIARRIQSCGVFMVSFLKRKRTHQEGARSEEAENYALRLRPGVREVATEIAELLCLLAPPNAVSKKAVSLATIRRMSLGQVATAFIRNELGNDIRRLLLVYAGDVFILTKNGTLVQLQYDNQRGKEDRKHLALVPPLSLTMATPTQIQEEKTTREESHINKAFAGPTKAVPVLSLSNSACSFALKEADTVVHMGKRFVAPAAMERYRLSQRLLPLLEFIPAKNTITDATQRKKALLKLPSLVENACGDEAFVDFVAVRERAVARHPHLGPFLAFDKGDPLRFRDGLVMSVLRALGVEFRCGRTPPARELRPVRQHHIAASASLPPEAGIFFCRKVVGQEGLLTPSVSLSGEKISTCLLLMDLQVEESGAIMASPHVKVCWSLSFQSHGTEDGNVDASFDEKVLVGNLVNGWDHAFLAVSAVVYNEMVERMTIVPRVTEPSVIVPSLSLSTTTYNAGASACSALARHLLRCFAVRHHENLHDVLVNEIQGRVPLLFRHEAKVSVACLFFPYGQNDSVQNSVTEKSGGICDRSVVGQHSGPLVFNKYVDGFYKSPTVYQLPLIRPREVPEEPPLARRRLIPAKLMLEILCALYHEQQRRADEIGLEVELEDENIGESDGDDFVPFASILHALHPASRAYIRDTVGYLTMIPLLIACFPRYFRVPVISTTQSWSTIALTHKGRRLVQQLKRASLSSSLSMSTEGGISFYRSQCTGCCFTDNICQQLDAFLILCSGSYY